MAVDVSKFLKLVTLPEVQLEGIPKPRKTLPRLTEKFLPPVPEVWAVKAYKAGLRYGSYSALLVGLLLWREHRLNGDNRPLKLSKAKLRTLGVSKYSARRSLEALEKAGLITVQRFKHRSPLVTLIGIARR
jgi:hypothetical protein